MFDKHWVGASLQHSEQSVSLGRWTVELGVRSADMVEPLCYVIHNPFPRSLVGLSSGFAVDFNDVMDRCECGAVASSVP